MDAPLVNIMQWNSRSIKANLNSLSHYVETHPHISILAISETHLSPTDSFTFRDFVSYRADRFNQKGGGVGLFVHPKLPAEQIHFHTQLEAVAIRTNFRGKKTTIISLYLPPNENRNKELEDLLSQVPHPAIICGDFNAHIQNFGSTYSNTRGRFLQQLVNRKNFTIMNTDQPTLLQRPDNNPTAPDFTLVSDQMIDQFSWEVSDLTLGSDHYPIHITAPPPQPSKGPKILSPPLHRMFHRADWEKYTQFLEQDISTFTGPTNRVLVRSFCNKHTRSRRHCHPLVQTSKRQPKQTSKTLVERGMRRSISTNDRSSKTVQEKPGLHAKIR
jgi:hypothetical protein